MSTTTTDPPPEPMPDANIDQHAADAPADQGGSHRLAIAILVLSAFVVILNETILSVALTHLMDDLGVDEPTVQWVSTAFLLTMAVVIPTTGYLLQRLTTRALYLAAMGLFLLGTVISAAAPGIEMLLVGRVVQACGTAIMMPMLMTTVLQLVAPNRRGQVMGTVMIVISVAPALGPTVSGVILQFLAWRWIFLIMLPIAVLMTVIGALKLPNVSEPERSRLDLLSIPLTVIGFGGLVFGLNSFGEGASSPTLWVSLALGVVGLALFVWRQLTLQRSGTPLLDLRTFVHRPFTIGLGLIMVGFAALIGVAILWPIYLERVHHIDPIVIGMMLLPGGLAMGLLGPVIGRLYDRLGAKVLAVPASIALTVFLFSMSRTSEATPEWLLVALHLLMSLSLAFMFTPVFTSALNSLPPSLYSHGSATLGALQQVAGGAGTALLVALMAATRASQEAGGANESDATMAGIRMAVTVAAGLAAGAVVLTLMLRPGAPEASPDGDGAPAAAH